MEIQVGCVAGVYPQQPMAQVLLMADEIDDQKPFLVLLSVILTDHNFKRLQNALKRLRVGSSNYVNALRTCYFD